MICRNCGTEIADKALICYRCGTATVEPRVKPPVHSPARGRGRGLVALLALLILAAAGLLMGQAAQGAVPRDLGYALAALAAVVIVWRVIATRVR